ncbi:MAG: hypothetical protein IIU16_05980, partial [Bacteroidales bacterium]|nr:hypothetical protein [Bacteroidales bacterium]
NVGKPMFIDSKISQADFDAKRQELEDIMVKQLRDLDAEFNLYMVEQDLTSSEFKDAKRQGRAPKLTKRYR